MRIFKSKEFGAFLVIGLIVALIIAFFWGNYNTLIDKETKVEKSAAQIYTQLERRADLIPNLVNVVKRYAAHEEGVYTAIANARAALHDADSMKEKATANAEVDSALNRLMVIVENYPDLKASENFAALQDELAGTENRIAYARDKYNEAVESYNTAMRKFPKNVVASVFGFEKAEFFTADASKQAVPEVTFE